MKHKPWLVEVLWIDSTAQDGWVSEKETLDKIDVEDYQDCWAAGYLVHTNEFSISLSLGWCYVDKKTDERDFHTVLSIPRGAIKKMWRLDYPDGPPREITIPGGSNEVLTPDRERPQFPRPAMQDRV